MACAPTANPAVVPTLTAQVIPTQVVSREAQVHSVEIQFTNTTPAQVNTVIRSHLTESCAVPGESQVEYASNTFRITGCALSPADRVCVQTTTPFETTIALNTSELPTGTYAVIAIGVSAGFTLPENSVTPTNTAIPSAVPTTVPVSQACTNAATFVTDLAMPDNAEVAPNTAFTKTWRLKNTGTCTWDDSYLVPYIAGTPMSQQPDY